MTHNEYIYSAQKSGKAGKYALGTRSGLVQRRRIRNSTAFQNYLLPFGAHSDLADHKFQGCICIWYYARQCALDGLLQNINMFMRFYSKNILIVLYMQF